MFKELMVFVKGLMGPIPFESKTDDAEAGTELVAGLEGFLENASGLENEKFVTSSQTATGKHKNRARAEALRNAFLGNFTF